MSRSIKKRLPGWTSVRLGLVVFAACSGGSLLTACSQQTDVPSELSREELASAGSTTARRDVATDDDDEQTTDDGDDTDDDDEQTPDDGDDTDDDDEQTTDDGDDTDDDEQTPGDGDDADVDVDVDVDGEMSMPDGNRSVVGGDATAAATACGKLDWSQAKLQVTAPASSPNADTLTSLSAELLDSALCVRVTGAGVVGSKYNLYVETDGKLRTGVQTSSWIITGAEYWVSGGVLRKATGPNFAFDPVTKLVDVASGTHELVFSLPRDALTLTVSEEKVGVGFQLLNGNDAGAVLPAGPALVQLDSRPVGDELDTRACTTPSTAVGGRSPVANPRPGRAAISVNKGVIAPLYLPVPVAGKPVFDALGNPVKSPQQKQWELVAEASAEASARGGAASDFWIVLNGSENAPPKTSTEWTNAKAVWEPQGKSVGHLFGYVHTVVSRKVGEDIIVGPTLRPLADVENEITSWVTNLEGLDGIWLDEFIPRFEVADTAGNIAPPPNPGLGPIDPNLTEYAGSFGALQVDPTCGYYDRLTRWIHESYPWLRIIGNAGGSLQTNQRAYARLVDVFVGFEHSLLEASAGGFAPLAKGFEPLARANLALIHAGTPDDAPTADRKRAIDEAFKAGFSHVYATDSLYSTGGDQSKDPNRLGNLNVWGDLPADALGKEANTAKPPSLTSGLSDELKYVAGKF